MLKDIFGNDVHAGDYIIYAVRGVKYGDPIRLGLIHKITEIGWKNYKGEKVTRLKMTVKYMKKRWSHEGGKFFTTKHVVDTNRTLVKISDTDAEEFKKRGLVP